MHPNLVFWTAAIVNLLAVAALVAMGIRSIRRGDLSGHRRRMKTAAALVVAFLGAYPLKLIWLGRERVSEWSEGAIVILRIHEVCVLAMLAGGATALILSRGMHPDRNRLTRLPDAPLAAGRTLRRHRTAGWTAAIAAGLAFVTAAIVLLGMFEREAGA